MPQSCAKQNRADNREKEAQGEEHKRVSRRLRRLNGGDEKGKSHQPDACNRRDAKVEAYPADSTNSRCPGSHAPQPDTQQNSCHDHKAGKEGVEWEIDDLALTFWTHQADRFGTEGKDKEHSARCEQNPCTSNPIDHLYLRQGLRSEK